MADNNTDLDPLAHVKEIAERNERITDEMIKQLEIRHRENQRQLTDLFRKVDNQFQIISSIKDDSIKNVDGTQGEENITDHDRIVQLEKEIKERKLEKKSLEGEVRKNSIILQWRRLYTKLQEKASNEKDSNSSDLMENLEKED